MFTHRATCESPVPALLHSFFFFVETFRAKVFRESPASSAVIGGRADSTGLCKSGSHMSQRAEDFYPLMLDLIVSNRKCFKALQCLVYRL